MIIHDETTYRQHVGLNFSSAKNLLKSPLHFKAAQEAKREPSKNMLFGSIVHAKVLEGKNYPVAVMPDGLDGRTKEGKDWKAANAGKETISQDDWKQCQRMIDAVMGNKDVAYLLSLKGESEVGIVQDYRGTKIKGRIDRLFKDENGAHCVLDLKSTQSALKHDFSASCSQFCYWLQAAFYSALVALEFQLENRCPYYIVCVENTDACDVCIYSLSPEAFAVGQAQMERVVDLFKSCTTSGIWPGSSSGIAEITPPQWEVKKYLAS